MSITVPNTRPDTPVVTLFGRLEDGSCAAKVLEEASVPYTACWDNALEQVMVYIEPDKGDLAAIVAALNEGRLDFSALQEYGASDGGTSTFPV